MGSMNENTKKIRSIYFWLAYIKGKYAVNNLMLDLNWGDFEEWESDWMFLTKLNYQDFECW